MQTNINIPSIEVGNNEHRVVAPVIVAGNNFEPSIEYKNWWLNTRKNKVKIGNVELNGLFSTYSYGWDKLSFTLILLIEFWGLYNLNVLIDNVVLSSLMFVCDALFAIGSHYWSKDLILARNRLEMAKFDIIYLKGRTLKSEKEIETHKIRNYTILQWVFNFFISGLATFKIFSYLGNTAPDTPFALSFTLILSYVLVAFLHIRSTGYYLSELIRNFRYNSEYDKNLNDPNPLATIQNHRIFDLNLKIQENHEELVDLAQRFGFKAPAQPHINFVDGMTGQHYISKNVLYTWGILEDRDLHNLISSQSTNKQKEYLAMYGLWHQIEILNAPVAANAGNRIQNIDPALVPTIK